MPASADKLRWIPGDVHQHVTPPDTDVTWGVADIAKEAKAAGLEFVVITPHLWGSARGATFDRTWTKMAADARKTTGIALVPGVEWTTPQGHFTVAGIDVTKVGGDFLGSAHRMGAWISVNHPFAVPTRIPGVAASHYDMSYKPWNGSGAAVALDGVEVWNVPLGFANVIRKPGGKSGEDRAWLAADQLARENKQRVTAVGGTDNHKLLVMPTTWILAETATEASVLDALRNGATCVGGPEAGTLEARASPGSAGARSDAKRRADTIDGGWVRIGGIVRGPKGELRWQGGARLFVDGVDKGILTGSFTHVTNGVPHTYRLAVGGSRCGFIYANL